MMYCRLAEAKEWEQDKDFSMAKVGIALDLILSSLI
jgi:hypothetical protein